jgi:hypothetical protein
MDVEVLTGPPGCGKSYDVRQEAIANPGLYLFAYPSIPLLQEQAAAFAAEADAAGKPDLPVLEAHHKAQGGGTVPDRLERHRQYLLDRRIDHAVVLITHEGMMGADFSRFGDWNIRIDEAPATIQSGHVKAPASADLLKQIIAIDRVGSGGWGQLRFLGEKQGWRSLANDDLLKPLAEMFKQVSRQHGVFVDTLEWTESFGWCSIWPFASLGQFASAKIAGASFLISLGAIVAQRWEVSAVNFVTVPKQVRRQKQPNVRIHYFTQSHEGTTTFWEKRRGRRFIAQICDFLVANEPNLGFWAGNDVTGTQLDARLNSKPISPKSAGLNRYDDETSCALIYSSKALPADRPAQALFGITEEEIFRAREEEDILQFVMRGAIRRPDFGDDYDIYLYSKRQAKLVAEKLRADSIGRTITLIAEVGAGIMDALPDPLAPIRAAFRAEKDDERREEDNSRKRDERATRAISEGREPSANNGKGGRPKGSKDKKARKPRGRAKASTA